MEDLQAGSAIDRLCLWDTGSEELQDKYWSSAHLKHSVCPCLTELANLKGTLFDYSMMETSILKDSNICFSKEYGKILCQDGICFNGICQSESDMCVPHAAF